MRPGVHWRFFSARTQYSSRGSLNASFFNRKIRLELLWADLMTYSLIERTCEHRLQVAAETLVAAAFPKGVQISFCLPCLDGHEVIWPPLFIDQQDIVATRLTLFFPHLVHQQRCGGSRLCRLQIDIRNDLKLIMWGRCYSLSC